MFALSAAGFIATSRFGTSPGVTMSKSAMCTWKLRDAGDRAGRGADLGRVVRQRREVVAEGCAHVGEAIPDELHAVTRVAGESDHHPVEHLGLAGLECRFCHVVLTLTPARPRRCARTVVAPSAREVPLVGYESRRLGVTGPPPEERVYFR